MSNPPLRLVLLLGVFGAGTAPRAAAQPRPLVLVVHGRGQATRDSAALRLDALHALRDTSERHFVAELVDEVRALEARGLRRGRTAPRALGYAQVLRMLDGEVTPEQAKAETVQATRRFARRQESWFRRDRRIRWLPYDAPDLVQRVIDHAAGRCDAAPTLSP
jgi:tRNA A37 N6-isopentenylltransferase MiaA